MIHAKDLEFKIQARFITGVLLAHPDILMTISPGGFIMSAGMAMKMIRMGYRKGTPDVLIFEPRGPWHGLFIEFKKPGGVVADAQVEFARAATERNYLCHVCFSTEDAWEVLENYLGGRLTC